MELMVSAIRVNGDDNLDIELMDPAGADLPAFEPGAHIDIRTPAGPLRQYSLCGPATDRRRYRICVRKDPASRGGSRSLHADLRVRGRIEASAPRNLFGLPDAGRYILVSAGIGITPIIAMARDLAARGAQFELHHFERSRARVPFLDELEAGPLATAVTLHLGEEGGSFRHAPPASLGSADPDAAVLACGPSGFLDLMGERLTEAGWQPHQFHFERFRVEPAPVANVAGVGFEVRVASSGRSFPVGPADTIAKVLMAHGVAVELSCEQGMCGACLTGVLEGTPDHRDIVLSDAERASNTQMTLCCSRSLSPVLVLDL
ncbi:xanthine hydroxylase reductase [Kaistia sp. 32K]|uniref:PDR/VanB family oxidoreductase n=1 Tax=Kaistia sp. 32K TaxID=2795690 RepID=UPI0019157332|nr:PDR/VanB family oxidoreductase [Kaistia sp. 32K]BCP51548.1 xanthine hydroxylase reductase [Kaistia sp. 32K]